MQQVREVFGVLLRGSAAAVKHHLVAGAEDVDRTRVVDVIIHPILR